MDDTVKCIECGDGACVCCCEERRTHKEKWSAHCMTCDNSTGKRGYYDPCHDSEEEAIAAWNTQNS